MFKKSFCLWGLIVPCFLSAQTTGTNSDVIPAIIPPSPNSAAIDKFGVVPVDYSTGVPAISYPMWSWKRGRLSFDLGISYHAGGHKVEDMPSNTGLGWALTSAGRISRTVRGINDDKVNYGFMNSPVLPELVTYNYNGGYNAGYYNSDNTTDFQTVYPPATAITDYNSIYSALVNSVSAGYMDGQQDIFTYSFAGGSGRFIIDKAKKVVPLEHTNHKFSFTTNSVNGNILSFTITDDKGLIYKYATLEYQHADLVTTSQAVTAPALGDYISGWLLSSIIDPTVKDTIVFSYATPFANVYYEGAYSESQTLNIEMVQGFLVVHDYSIDLVSSHNKI